jgi:hypothetical protein
MNRSFFVGITLALIGQFPASYAGSLSVSGTGVLYDPSGNTVGAPTPITGTYDTDTQHIAIDPWMFFGSPVDSQIDLLSPGSYTFPGVLPINVGSGQLGGIISTTWNINIIPHGIVWDVISHPGGQHFEPTDSDGDGIPGQKMISGPFPGFTFVYEFDVGAPAPSIDVSINVTGGVNQECNETGGSHVELTATVDLKGGADLASIDWTVDGNAAGSGTSTRPFLALGSHLISVTATGVGGIYDTASTTVNVIDTVKPDLAIEVVDTRTGQAVTSVNGSGVSFIEVRLNGTDACDSNVDVAGAVKPVYAVIGGEVIKIQGNNGNVTLPTTALEVSATATDGSGNKQSNQLILPIIK